MKKLLLILGIILWASQVWGATYYVKNGGNDRLDGLSDSTAWATIAKVNATVKYGDTVYFRSQDTWEAASGSRVLSATAGVAYNGSTYGAGTRAKFKAVGNQVANATGFGVVDIHVSNVTFKGFEIDCNQKKNTGINVAHFSAIADFGNITINDVVVHDNGDPNDDDWNYGILVSSNADPAITVSNITIQNSTLYNNGHEGIAIYQSWPHPGNRTNGVLIRNCTVHDTGATTTTKNGTGILIANDSDNVTVEYCTLYNNMGGIYIRTSPLYEGANGAPDNMIIRYNYIYNSYSQGIQIVNPQGANKAAPMSMSGSFYNNLIVNTAAECLSPYKDGWDFSIGTFNWNKSVFNIYNNTFYNTVNTCTNTMGVIGVGNGGEAEGWRGTPTIHLKNNIVYAGNFKAIWDRWNVLTHSNNLVYRSSGSSDVHVLVGTGTNYNRAGILTWEPSAKNTNPLFKGGTLPTGFTGTYGNNMVPNTDYFSITTGDALNNGATLGSPYNGCINGAGLATPIYRPAGAYDIGAYEYVKSVIGGSSLPAPTGLRFDNQ